MKMNVTIPNSNMNQLPYNIVAELKMLLVVKVPNPYGWLNAFAEQLTQVFVLLLNQIKD